MGKRLYVGNLPYDADEDAIRTAFTEAGGTVERVHIPLDRDTQRPRGFAFVEMSTDEEAQRAIEAMNGATLGTRTMRVSEAEERRPAGGPRPRRDEGGSSGASGSGGSDQGRSPREGRERRFGPDARPSRERQWDRGGKRGGGARRRQGGDGGGRRGGGGNNRYDDYDY